MQGIEFVVAAYVLTWVGLGAYTGHVWRRVARGERELRREAGVTAGAVAGARPRGETVGGAA